MSGKHPIPVPWVGMRGCKAAITDVHQNHPIGPPAEGRQHWLQEWHSLDSSHLCSCRKLAVSAAGGTFIWLISFVLLQEAVRIGSRLSFNQFISSVLGQEAGSIGCRG